MVLSSSVFECGQLYQTSRVFDASCEHEPFGTFVRQCLERHVSGDWGACCPEDAALNDAALLEGSRIFSVYDIPQGLFALSEQLWVITEADRSYTTVLFPSEY